MGLPAGCEIVAHYICSQLESDPSLVITKVDVKNAFNKIDRSAIQGVVSANLPQVLPFADLLLAQYSMQTIFNDSRAGINSVYKMDKGVPQGGSISSALFNMGQSTFIRRAAQLHPTVSIPLIADDMHCSCQYHLEGLLYKQWLKNLNSNPRSSGISTLASRRSITYLKGLLPLIIFSLTFVNSNLFKNL